MAKDILISFGRKVQTIRKQKGWSQEELANISGFHRTYIGFIERGERNISLKAIEKLAKTFDMPIHELLKNL